ncbi:T9SS type A sorting domain-containing protein [Flavobacterium amniphilum]|uniref:T9SS type A sorting domain-containing protein n=1 Tax=Flavobacterium amniphilum TaxID=1834035 RepID=UPI00202A52F6|nr:T9SS type A sorting domain-containing protein [Flavobacterium amniphilum]MCL9804606.1 T9SS type A sorting domain-containing protein [Flavobacterium amniphilum]
MIRLLFTMMLCSSIKSFGQDQKIRFDYDTAGNQITREYCLNCFTKTEIKDTGQLTDSDLTKFVPEDSFAYYPNPVKEELYLKWNNSLESKISSIKLFSLNGSLLKSFDHQENSISQNIHFGNYPSGIYFIILAYNTGGEKSIKIIKQ